MGHAVSSRTPRVNLTKYVQIVGEGWRFCPVVTTAAGRPKQDIVVVDGKPERHPEGYYALDYRENGKRMRPSVGADVARAWAEQQKMAALLKAKVHGVAVEEDSREKGIRLQQASDEFLDEIKAQQKSKKTYAQYSLALKYFLEICDSNVELKQIGKKDLMRFAGYLRAEKELSDRTVWNKFTVVVSMLKLHGVTGFLRKNDWPKFIEPEPQVYTDEELHKFFSKCDPRSYAAFKTLLMSGVRDQEWQSLYVTDVNFTENTIRIREKSEIDFRPKNWERREIPIPDELVEILRRHIVDLPKGSRLLFPNEEGNRDYHLLTDCKEIAKAAGLNCGNCITKRDGKNRSCADAAVCCEWFLHKFRATFCTKHLRAGVDLRTVQLWMGHKDLASTMRYLQPARGKDVREKVNNTFGTPKPQLVKTGA